MCKLFHARYGRRAQHALPVTKKGHKYGTFACDEWGKKYLCPKGKALFDIVYVINKLAGLG